MKLFFQKYPKNSEKTEHNTKVFPPLLFLHGLGGTGQIWRPIAAHLEEFCDIYCPDQKGHGKSLTNSIDLQFTPQDFASDLFETFFQDNLSFKSWIIGHSMGCRTASAFCAIHEERSLGLILIDLSLFGRAGGGIGEILELFLDKLPPTFPSRNEARNFLNIHCPDPAIALYLLAVSQIDPATGQLTFPFQKDALLKIIQQALSQQTGDFVREFSLKSNKPVYVLRGEKSLVYTREAFELDQKKMHDLSNVHFIEFSKAGHGLPFEKRVEFCEWLKTILSQNSP